MNYPGASPRKRVSGKSKTGRLRFAMLVAAIAAFAAFVSPAFANVTPTVTTSYESSAPGGHGFYEITQTYQYDGSPEPTSGTEDLKKWVLDSPAGLTGNPNAIPYAERCTPAEFEPVTGAAGIFFNSACPASSKVGTATVTFVTDALSGAIPGGTPLTATTGDIYLLQTDPEVPTTLATRLNSAWYQNVPTTPCASPAPLPCPLYPKTKSIVQPVTTGVDGDFRLRTIPSEDSTRPYTYGPTGSGFPAGVATPLHIRSITYHLNGYAPNGNPFITYPTNLGPWNSLSYATAYDSNTTPDYDPDPDVTHNDYKKSTNVDAKTPDQTLAAFSPATAVTFSTGARDSNPQVDVAVSNTSAMPGSDYPKKSVVTFPASLTTDLQGIGNLCEVADRNANTCPAASKVGSAKVETPLLVAGMSGDVYIVRSDDAIPDLAIFFNNPPNSIASFRMDGTTKFVGARGNQIETTLDNGPQNPWTKFTVTINGGTDTLLTISKCPDGSTSPEDGPITNVLTGFSGQSATTSTTPVFDDCHGVSKLKKIRKCVKRKLKVSPSYQSRSLLAKSELWIKRSGTKKYRLAKRLKKSPYRFSVKLRRSIRSGKHKYKVRAVYGASPAHPSGHVLQRYSTFRKC